MEVDSHRSRGSQGRIVVGNERYSGNAANVDDENQQQDFAAKRQRVLSGPMAVYAKDQPAWNDDRTEDKNRKRKRTVGKQRKEKFGDHVGRSLKIGQTKSSVVGIRITTSTFGESSEP